MHKNSLWILALPLLAACAPQVDTTIALSDVTDVAATGLERQVPALLRIPQAGLDNCRQALDQLTRSLGEITPIAEDPECVDIDSEQFAQFETVLTIYSGTEAPDTLLQLQVDAAEGGGTNLVFSITRTLDEVTQAVGSSFAAFATFPTFDETPRFFFDIVNDTDSSAELTLDHVFADGEPMLEGHSPLALAPAGEVRITLSDVASIHAANALAYLVARVDLTP